MTSTEPIYMNQTRIFDPEKQRSNIVIVGAGSTGSFIALTLAKMGFNDINVIDFDKVEAHNIPNQFYRLDDVGNEKIKALSDIITSFTGTSIKITSQKLDETTPLDISLNTIVVICVDNMEARKVIYNHVKDYPIKIVDTRMGGEGFSIHVCDLSQESEKEAYRKSLDYEIMETVCGEKSIIYTILSIASETSNIVKRIDYSEKYPRILRREMKTYRFISDMDKTNNG